MNGIQWLSRSCEVYEESKLALGVNILVLSSHDLKGATVTVCPLCLDWVELVHKFLPLPGWEIGLHSMALQLAMLAQVIAYFTLIGHCGYSSCIVKTLRLLFRRGTRLFIDMRDNEKPVSQM